MKINILEAKNRLSQLIQSALAGEEIIIAKRGNPIVRLVPIEPEEQDRVVASSTLGISDWLKENPIPEHLKRSHEDIENTISSQKRILGLIYLDSCLLIYALERDPVFGERVTEALDSHSNSEFAISPLVKLECLVKPIESGNTALKQYYEAAFETLVSLPISEVIYIEAAQLRARFGLKTPDALHLSCAQYHRCDSLWTNDNRLFKAGHGLAANICTN